MDTLPPKTIELIVQFTVSCRDLVTFANLGLVCRDFHRARPDPLLYFPIKYIKYYIYECDMNKVMEILPRITKRIRYDCLSDGGTMALSGIFRSLFRALFACTVDCIDINYIVLESLFLHDTLHEIFDPLEHRIVLKRMVVIKRNMDYLLKALAIVDFAWDRDLLNPFNGFQCLLEGELIDILLCILKAQSCTATEAVTVLPQMFCLEPKFYKCIRVQENDVFTYHNHIQYREDYEGMTAKIPEQVRPTFEMIVNKKKEGLGKFRAMQTSNSLMIDTYIGMTTMGDPLIALFAQHTLKNVFDVLCTISRIQDTIDEM